ncbi:hypothetical protein HDU85_000794 [Gaertneriomyces sp. JEL0708]|nr:hypothetical protein HDU85_000794 [Gaertneriomyces sp. JEL0708]
MMMTSVAQPTGGLSSMPDAAAVAAFYASLPTASSAAIADGRHMWPKQIQRIDSSSPSIHDLDVFIPRAAANNSIADAPPRPRMARSVGLPAPGIAANIAPIQHAHALIGVRPRTSTPTLRPSTATGQPTHALPLSTSTNGVRCDLCGLMMSLESSMHGLIQHLNQQHPGWERNGIRRTGDASVTPPITPASPHETAQSSVAPTVSTSLGRDASVTHAVTAASSIPNSTVHAPRSAMGPLSKPATVAVNPTAKTAVLGAASRAATVASASRPLPKYQPVPGSAVKPPPPWSSAWTVALTSIAERPKPPLASQAPLMGRKRPMEQGVDSVGLPTASSATIQNATKKRLVEKEMDSGKVMETLSSTPLSNIQPRASVGSRTQDPPLAQDGTTTRAAKTSQSIPKQDDVRARPSKVPVRTLDIIDLTTDIESSAVINGHNAEKTFAHLAQPEEVRTIVSAGGPNHGQLGINKTGSTNVIKATAVAIASAATEVSPSKTPRSSGGSVEQAVADAQPSSIQKELQEAGKSAQESRDTDPLIEFYRIWANLPLVEGYTCVRADSSDALSQDSEKRSESVFEDVSRPLAIPPARSQEQTSVTNIANANEDVCDQDERLTSRSASEEQVLEEGHVPDFRPIANYAQRPVPSRSISADGARIEQGARVSKDDSDSRTQLEKALKDLRQKCDRRLLGKRRLADDEEIPGGAVLLNQLIGYSAEEIAMALPTQAATQSPDRRVMPVSRSDPAPSVSKGARAPQTGRRTAGSWPKLAALTGKSVVVSSPEKRANAVEQSNKEKLTNESLAVRRGSGEKDTGTKEVVTEHANVSKRLERLAKNKAMKNKNLPATVAASVSASSGSASTAPRTNKPAEKPLLRRSTSAPLLNASVASKNVATQPVTPPATGTKRPVTSIKPFNKGGSMAIREGPAKRPLPDGPSMPKKLKLGPCPAKSTSTPGPSSKSRPAEPRPDVSLRLTEIGQSSRSARDRIPSAAPDTSEEVLAALRFTMEDDATSPNKRSGHSATFNTPVVATCSGKPTSVASVATSGSDMSISSGSSPERPATVARAVEVSNGANASETCPAVARLGKQQGRMESNAVEDRTRWIPLRLQPTSSRGNKLSGSASPEDNTPLREHLPPKRRKLKVHWAKTTTNISQLKPRNDIGFKHRPSKKARSGQFTKKGRSPPRKRDSTGGPVGQREVESSGSEFDVEQILDVREKSNSPDTVARTLKWHTKEYLVQWLGYGPKFDTWEPAEGLVNAEGKVKEFWEAKRRLGKEWKPMRRW